MIGSITVEHRQQIEEMLLLQMSYGEIAEEIGVSLTCVYTEVRKNSNEDGIYNAQEAHRRQQKRIDDARARQKETWAAKRPEKGKCRQCKGLGKRWIQSGKATVPLEIVCRPCGGRGII